MAVGIERERVTSSPAGQSISYGSSDLSGQTALNHGLTRVLIGFLALAPIPLGSNRPFFWALNALALGFVGIWYVVGIIRAHEGFRYGPTRMWPTVTLFILLVAYLLVQTLPIGAIELGGTTLSALTAIPTIDGDQILLDSISVSPTSTMLMVLRWLTYGMLFFLVAQIAVRSERRNLVLNALLGIVTAYALFGLASLLQFGDTILGMTKWAYQGNATATFVNRNSFATFLSMGAVVSMALIMGTFVRQTKGEERLRPRLDPLVLVYLVALAAIVGALLATQSRMGAFAGALGCLVVLLLARGRLKWRRRWDLVLLPMFLLFGAGVAYLYGQGVIERLGSAGASSDVRLDLYAQIVQMIEVRPLLGYGGGTFELAFPTFHRLPVSPDLIWDRAHNSYLALWSELGLIAGSLPMLMIALAAGRLVWGLGKAQSDWMPRAAAIGAIVVASVHSLTDFSLEIQANVFVFVTLLALGTVAAVSTRRSTV